MAQPSLFDAPATRGASRKSDPRTARDAGRSMSGHVLRDQQALVLRHAGTLDRWGRDFTAWELWEHMDSTFLGHGVTAPKENVISKRLGELRESGMVELTGGTRPGSSHRHQQAFALTAAGREWLAGEV